VIWKSSKASKLNKSQSITVTIKISCGFFLQAHFNLTLKVCVSSTYTFHIRIYTEGGIANCIDLCFLICKIGYTLFCYHDTSHKFSSTHSFFFSCTSHESLTAQLKAMTLNIFLSHSLLSLILQPSYTFASHKKSITKSG
jgi:hypothetical protein